MSWVWLVLVGAAVGILGRLLHPGRELLGFLVTVLIGIVSLVAAGIIFSGFWAFLVGIVVAVILVTLFSREKTTPAV
ncbi:MAG: GlsB/YeaQ/YmgE family stress response membrane protein [Gaiellaceae bacterium]